MPAFIQDSNERFAKPPRDAHEAHRPLRDDGSLNLIFAWRELRKVTHDLTLHYERKLYLLPDTADIRRLIGEYIDIYQYPDGKIEIRARGQSLPYSTYYKLGDIDQGAIVDSKRLSAVLHVAQLTQANRDSRVVSVPSSAHRSDGTRVPRSRRPGTKTQRKLGPVDLQKAIQKRASLAAVRRGQSILAAALPARPSCPRIRQGSEKAAIAGLPIFGHCRAEPAVQTVGSNSSRPATRTTANPGATPASSVIDACNDTRYS